MTIEKIKITDRASWLALRRADLTASDIPAVAGADPYRSPLMVYAEKTGLVEPTADSNLMRRGRWLEAAVFEALLEEFPAWELRRAGVYLRDAALRMGATPDLVAIDRDRPGIGNIQCKVVARPRFDREWQDGRAPLAYQLQTLAEGSLLDSGWNAVAALVIDTYRADLVVDFVDRHAAAEESIRNLVRGFWENVARGVRPAVDYSLDAKIVEAMHMDSYPGIVADLSDDESLVLALSEREQLQSEIKTRRARIDEIETRLKARLGNAETAEAPGWAISWKTQEMPAERRPAQKFRVLRIQPRRDQAPETDDEGREIF